MNELIVQSGRQLAPRTADQGYLDGLLAELEPPSEEMMISAVSAMLQCFPAQQLDPATARMRAKGYRVGLRGASLRGLQKACEAYLQGVSVDGRRFNFAFPPSPGELRQLCDHFDGPTRERIERVMSRPGALQLPPRVRLTEEQRAERLKQVEAAKRELDKATEELRQEADERRKRNLEVVTKVAAARLTAQAQELSRKQFAEALAELDASQAVGMP